MLLKKLSKLFWELSYPKKNIFILLPFIISLVIIAGFLIKTQYDVISISKKEMEGLTYQKLYGNLYKNLLTHDLLSIRYFSGDKSWLNTILNLQKEIDLNFKNISLLTNQQNHVKSSVPISPSDIEIKKMAGNPKILEKDWNFIKNQYQTFTLETSNYLQEKLINTTTKSLISHSIIITIQVI
jgi:hypothetical protein